MKFSGPDLVPGKFEVNATVVSKNVFSKDVLEQAATRLLAAWPMLSFRVNTLVWFIARVYGNPQTDVLSCSEPMPTKSRPHQSMTAFSTSRLLIDLSCLC